MRFFGKRSLQFIQYRKLYPVVEDHVEFVNNSNHLSLLHTQRIARAYCVRDFSLEVFSNSTQKCFDRLMVFNISVSGNITLNIHTIPLLVVKSKIYVSCLSWFLRLCILNDRLLERFFLDHRFHLHVIYHLLNQSQVVGNVL